MVECVCVHLMVSRFLCSSLLRFLSPAVSVLMSGVDGSSVCSSTKYLSIATEKSLLKEREEKGKT